MPVSAVISNDEALLSGLDDDEVKRLIRRLIKNPPLTSRVITIFPAVAEWILQEYNLQNRPPKPNSIARFATDMNAIAWAITGDCLKFSDGLKLRDGQNRLRACVRSGKPFTTHVVFGVPDSAFDRMDRGKVRSPADVLSIAGFQNANVLSGAVRHVHNLLSDNPSAREGLEPHECLQMVRDRYPTLIEFIPHARAIRTATGQPMTLVTALLYVFAKKNAAKADDFARGWASGRHVGRHGSIGTMEKALSALRSQSLGRVHEIARAAYIITAWNLYLAGNKGRIGQFKWEQGDPLPAIEG